MSHGCSCSRPLPRPSLSPPSSRKITRGTAASCHSSGLWWRIWSRSRRRPMWKRTIPSMSTRRSWPSRPRAALKRSRRLKNKEGSCIREFGSIEAGARVCGDQRKRDGQGDQCVASQLQNFDTRKTARAGEIEGLNNAKAVLAGADYSL